MKRFVGKRVLVTGAGGSIGAAAARRFALEGARVMLADIDPDRAAAVAQELAGARHVGADVGDPAAAAAAVKATVSAFGGIDVLFNNAGISGQVAPIQDLPIDEWDRIVRVNLRGMFLVLQQALQAMIAQETGGAVVNMGSSMAGWDVLAGSAGYMATKHGVVGLTRSAALDAAPWGIRVNAICPGVIETPLGVPAASREDYLAGIRGFADRIPLRRIGQPEDVAAAVAFLASDEAAHITGVDWLIDGGQTLQSWANSPDLAKYPRNIK